jgi:hypothetical protein
MARPERLVRRLTNVPPAAAISVRFLLRQEALRQLLEAVHLGHGHVHSTLRLVLPELLHLWDHHRPTRCQRNSRGPRAVPRDGNKAHKPRARPWAGRWPHPELQLDPRRQLRPVEADDCSLGAVVVHPADCFELLCAGCVPDAQGYRPAACQPDLEQHMRWQQARSHTQEVQGRFIERAVGEEGRFLTLFAAKAAPTVALVLLSNSPVMYRSIKQLFPEGLRERTPASSVGREQWLPNRSHTKASDQLMLTYKVGPKEDHFYVHFYHGSSRWS